MGKKEIHVAVTILFASVLSVFAMTGGNKEPGEIRQIQDALRNLRRMDNLQIAYTYTVSGKEEQAAWRTEVWSDLLTSSWTAEDYVTDVDGTRLYQRWFSDGNALFCSADWSGEWERQSLKQGIEMPYFDSVTTVNYGNEDITGIERDETESFIKISYTFTPEYLATLNEKHQASAELYVENNRVMQADRGEEQALSFEQLKMAQLKQMELENFRVTYKVDKNDILRSLTYSFDVTQPELVTEQDGTIGLGEPETLQNLIVFEIRGYNREFILDKIEQSASEIL